MAGCWAPTLHLAIWCWMRACPILAGWAAHFPRGGGTSHVGWGPAGAPGVAMLSQFGVLYSLPFFGFFLLAWMCNIRATSHTRLKVHDHCNLRALIGRKGGDRPSSLHIWRWRPKIPKSTSWMISLHGVLHGGLWIRFYGLPKFSSGPPSKG